MSEQVEEMLAPLILQSERPSGSVGVPFWFLQALFGDMKKRKKRLQLRGPAVEPTPDSGGYRSGPEKLGLDSRRLDPEIVSLMRDAENSFTVEIEEGHFGPNFGPNFDILSGGGVGVPLGLILAFSKKRKKKRVKDTRIIRITRLLNLLGSLEKIPVGSAS